MAVKHQELNFRTMLAAFLCLLLHKAQSATDFCQNALQNINNCWEWHSTSEFSPCTWGNVTVFGRCATLGLVNLKGCDVDVIKAGEHRAKLYTTLMDVICQNDTIYREFDSNKQCWNIARACAYNIVQLPIQTSDLICKNITAIVNDCKLKDHNPSRRDKCVNVTAMFLDALLEESEMCGASTLFAHLILLVLTSYGLTLL